MSILITLSVVASTPVAVLLVALLMEKVEQRMLRSPRSPYGEGGVAEAPEDVPAPGKTDLK
ncbi:hypothetical protein [Amycolatopsis sp. cmx-4-61]|uniref:hypothetical protein n=1 Tax=Amycolatopsis sp. cmx-4-61 TaxID=2790937 RepID=UPI003979D631